MASPFDVFNRPNFAVYRGTSPTSGHFDSQDRWIAPVLTTPAPQIQGHISLVDRMGRESQWMPGQAGVVEQGMLRFYTQVLLQKGDVLEAAQEGGITYRYRVLGLVRAHRFMAHQIGAPVRYEFEIREIPT